MDELELLKAANANLQKWVAGQQEAMKAQEEMIVNLKAQIAIYREYFERKPSKLGWED